VDPHEPSPPQLHRKSSGGGRACRTTCR
jgi:hypothetical protein